MDSSLIWRNELLEVLTGTTEGGSEVVLTPAHTVEILKSQGWMPPSDVHVMHMDRIIKPDGSVVEFEKWPSMCNQQSRDEWFADIARNLLFNRRVEDLGREPRREDMIGFAMDRRPV